MDNDWDVIEELEFWDDYKEIYGEDLTEKQKKEIIKKHKKNTNKTTGTGCATIMLLTIMAVVFVISVLLSI